MQGRCRHFEKLGAGTQTYQVMHRSETEGGRIPIGSICLLDREIVTLDVAFRTRVPFQENIRSLCKDTCRQAEEAKNKGRIPPGNCIESPPSVSALWKDDRSKAGEGRGNAHSFIEWAWVLSPLLEPWVKVNPQVL